MTIIFRFFLTALVISAKYLDDNFYKNEYYAKVGGISLVEFNTLETTLVSLLEF